VAVEPQTGTGLQRAAAQRQLQDYLDHADRRHPLVLPVGPVVPDVGRAAVDAAAAQARALLTGPFVVNTNGEQVTLTPDQIASMLGTHAANGRLDLTIDSAKLGVALGPAVTNLEHPPVDATFSVNAANQVSVVPSQDGMAIDLDAVGRAIVAGQRTINAPLHNVHPAHDTAWAQKLGITQQVSSFTTYFPAGQPRVHNIALAASVLNNTVVEPNQTFSLNDKLGPRTPEKGYVKAPILVEDGFGEDYGGGISQLTTTLYNAVFFGGYVDVEHSPHAFYISRYPMGREATIVYPTVDLKFRDDTDHGVLIRASTGATSVTVTFYGNNDGRVVHEQNRKILKTTPITDQLFPCPPPNPPVQDPNNLCAHLAPGEKEQSASGETGYDVEFDRVIDQPGRPEFRQHYYVSYPMLPNTVLVGAGAPSSGSTTPPGSTPTTQRAPSATATTTQRKT
jgi:vancomycin resistance protein YoaR